MNEHAEASGPPARDAGIALFPGLGIPNRSNGMAVLGWRRISRLGWEIYQIKNPAASGGVSR
jgi:hypothetical protein